MADAGEAIGLRIFGKLDAGCSSSDTKQEMPDMIWNDHRLIDVGNHIALAAIKGARRANSAMTAGKFGRGLMHSGSSLTRLKNSCAR